KSLMLRGLLASFCLSCGWFGSRLVGVSGGYWGWTALLMNLFAAASLFVWLFFKDPWTLSDTFKVFRRNWVFWVITGSVATALLEFPLSYAMVHAPAWVVTATFELTILVTPLITFPMFGRRIPMRGVVYSLLIVLGVFLIQWEQSTSVTITDLLAGIVPPLFAAIAYSVGDQLQYEIQRRGAKIFKRFKIPFIADLVIERPSAIVFLVLLGGLPLQAVFVALTASGLPPGSQLLTTLIVGIISIGIGQTIFIGARQKAVGVQIVGVDATVAGDVVCTAALEILLIHAQWPQLAGLVGIACIVIGIVLYSLYKEAD
ncbi:MAG: multidrug resistance efflux transporter family protein, partial [Patescibacteria group bacterium]